ncbi:hypothetical protein BH09PSE3_BH09PSE3_00440 [soil metagenome]
MLANCDNRNVGNVGEDAINGGGATYHGRRGVAHLNSDRLTKARRRLYSGVKFRDKSLRLAAVIVGAWGLTVGAMIARQLTIGGSSPRTGIAVLFLAMIIAVVPMFALAPSLNSLLSRDRPISSVEDMPEWYNALAIIGVVAAVGFGIVAMSALFPPPLEASGYKAWAYMDKRWMIELYLLIVGLIYLPGFIARVYGTSTNCDKVEAGATTAMPLLQFAIALTIGSVLAVLYVAPMLPGTVDRYLDMHDQAHLGAFQRIAQGATPYIDARTQYGPGHQIVTYAMMHGSDFTLRGFRMSQTWLNLAAIAVLMSMWIIAFGKRMGLAIAIASLAVSPLLITTFWGWGLLLRWIAPALVGAVFPLLLWRKRSDRFVLMIVLTLGVACGLLAWMAQENLTGAIMATALVLGAAMVRGVITLPRALIWLATFVIAQVVSLIVLIIATLGVAQLGETLHLYFLSTGLVFQGMTNTGWSEPESTFRRAYPFTPIIIYAVMIAVLYMPRRATVPDDDFHLGQIAGMAAAAVPLTMLSLFRADSPHFLGPSTALTPLLILIVAYLPGRWEWRLNVANIVRAALIGFLLLIYYNPIGNYRMRISNDRTFSDPRLIGNVAATAAGIGILRQDLVSVSTTLPINAGNVFERKLGFRPASGDHCCHNTKWTFQELSDTLNQVHDVVAGRSVFVDVAPPLESSALYFLADLKTNSPYLSRIMSIWTDDDVRTVTAEQLKNPPGCIVSGPSDTLITTALLKKYPAYAARPIPGPVGLTVFCLPPLTKNQQVYPNG